MINFFSASNELKILLEDTGLFKRVAVLQSLNDVSVQKQITPAAYIVYRGHSVLDTAGQGSRVKYTQNYTVVFTIANAQSQNTADNLIDDAGDFIIKALQAILGFKLNNKAAFVPTGNDIAGFDNSFSYIPFTFKTIFTL